MVILLSLFEFHPVSKICMRPFFSSVHECTRNTRVRAIAMPFQQQPVPGKTFQIGPEHAHHDNVTERSPAEF